MPTDSPAQTGYWWYCNIQSFKTAKLFYVTAVFGPANDVGLGGSLTSARKWAGEFRSYAAGKYDDDGGCAHFDTAGAAEANLKRDEDNITGPSNKGQFVYTTWRPAALP